MDESLIHYHVRQGYSMGDETEKSDTDSSSEEDSSLDDEQEVDVVQPLKRKRFSELELETKPTPLCETHLTKRRKSDKSQLKVDEVKLFFGNSNTYPLSLRHIWWIDNSELHEYVHVPLVKRHFYEGPELQYGYFLFETSDLQTMFLTNIKHLLEMLNPKSYFQTLDVMGSGCSFEPKKYVIEKAKDVAAFMDNLPLDSINSYFIFVTDFELEKNKGFDNVLRKSLTTQRPPGKRFIVIYTRVNKNTYIKEFIQPHSAEMIKDGNFDWNRDKANERMKELLRFEGTNYDFVYVTPPLLRIHINNYIRNQIQGVIKNSTGRILDVHPTVLNPLGRLLYTSMLNLPSTVCEFAYGLVKIVKQAMNEFPGLRPRVVYITLPEEAEAFDTSELPSVDKIELRPDENDYLWVYVNDEKFAKALDDPLPYDKKVRHMAARIMAEMASENQLTVQPKDNKLFAYDFSRMALLCRNSRPVVSQVCQAVAGRFSNGEAIEYSNSSMQWVGQGNGSFLNTLRIIDPRLVARMIQEYIRQEVKEQVADIKKDLEEVRQEVGLPPRRGKTSVKLIEGKPRKARNGCIYIRRGYGFSVQYWDEEKANCHAKGNGWVQRSIKHEPSQPLAAKDLYDFAHDKGLNKDTILKYFKKWHIKLGHPIPESVTQKIDKR